MELFVIRHAAAEPRSVRIEDARRPLTNDGRRRWLRAVRGLARLEVRFNRVYHSPWLRAVETVDALADLVDETVVTKELAKRPAVALLRALRGERIAVVGHQPWLGELVGVLAFGRLKEGAQFDLKKGAIVWLQGDPRRGGWSFVPSCSPRYCDPLATLPTH